MAGGVGNLLSTDNPVFAAYLFYSAVLVLKMLLMSALTGRQRFKNKVFANPEDTVGTKGKIRFDHPDVERVRRAHQNDLENIPLFLVTAGLYLLTGPASVLAVTLFRAFTGARIVHTLVYAVWVVPQPARALAFVVGYLITTFMAVSVIMHVVY